MGTINYGHSDYITMGAKLQHFSDFEEDAAFMEEARKQIAEYGGALEDVIYQEIQNNYEDDLVNIEWLLEKHSFHYYHISIEPGYYEGFYLKIENNFGVAYDSWKDRKEAQKEITEIKQFLIDCADCGLCSVYPGWTTHEFGYDETIQHIKEAIKEMREEVNAIPTWRQYDREVLA